jgi:hypothetical protein
MSSGRSSGDPRPPEQRAEEFMQRMTADASRILSRFVGRAREEIEDIVAEAKTLNERQTASRSKSQSNGRAPSKR